MPGGAGLSGLYQALQQSGQTIAAGGNKGGSGASKPSTPQSNNPNTPTPGAQGPNNPDPDFQVNHAPGGKYYQTPAELSATQAGPLISNKGSSSYNFPGQSPMGGAESLGTSNDGANFMPNQASNMPLYQALAQGGPTQPNPTPAPTPGPDNSPINPDLVKTFKGAFS